jgi:beta-carotene 15,15'-dioxygenase
VSARAFDWNKFGRHLLLPAIALVAWLVANMTSGVSATATAYWFAAAIILTGIPHGALDIDILTRKLGRADFATKAKLTGLYLMGVGAMAALWFTAPSIALTAFLIISIIHFGMDWQHLREPFLGFMTGWAIIALPAISHPGAVAAIFGALTGEQSGAIIAAILGATAVPAGLIAAAFCIDAASKRDLATAISVATCLVAGVALPPLASFALFFCGLHSPKHFAEALSASGPMRPFVKAATVVAVMALALAIGALLYSGIAVANDNARLVSSLFMLLSVLTLPHFCLEFLIMNKRFSLTV